MTSLVNTLIETIQKDINLLKNVEKDKHFRKETSLIISRIESAKKLVANDESLTIKLDEFKEVLKSLRE